MPAFPQINRAATAWARADRIADDRTAELQNLDQLIAQMKRPIPPELAMAREAVRREVGDACRLEGQAEDDLRDAARKLLDVHVVTAQEPEVSAEDLLERIRVLEAQLEGKW
jgi:hypothetical protein